MSQKKKKKAIRHNKRTKYYVRSIDSFRKERKDPKIKVPRRITVFCTTKKISI